MAHPVLKLYALSTCIHCRHTKEYLNSHHILYEFIDVDLQEGEARDRVLAEVKGSNPNMSFPTIVVPDGGSVIIGFQEQKLAKYIP